MSDDGSAINTEEPTAEDLASREDLLLAYDRLSRQR